MTVSKNETLLSTWRMLQVTFGLIPLLAGLDKYFNFLTDWTKYESPILQRMMPVSTITFMHVAGAVEMIVGLAILTRWTKLGSYVASLWLVGIALNLVTTGQYFDIAVRDLGLAVGALALGNLTGILDAHGVREVREETHVTSVRAA